MGRETLQGQVVHCIFSVILQYICLEKEVSRLFEKVYKFYIETLTPIETGDRLLTGKDVMEILGIPQGPKVGDALEALEEARCEGKVATREEAEAYLKEWYANFCP